MGVGFDVGRGVAVSVGSGVAVGIGVAVGAGVAVGNGVGVGIAAMAASTVAGMSGVGVGEILTHPIVRIRITGNIGKAILRILASILEVLCNRQSEGKVGLFDLPLRDS